MTMKTLILACLLIAVTQAAPQVKWAKLRERHFLGSAPFHERPQSRIVGGSLATAGEIPFQAGIFMDDTYFCGGSLIQPDLVLTAAHCVRAVRSFDVYLGSLRVGDPVEEGRVLVTTSTGLEHESYNSGQLVNDIALIMLGTSVELNTRIQTVRLTSLSGGDYAGATATVSGWGQESDESPSIAEDLQYTQVTVMSHDDCQANWGNVPFTQLCVDTNNGQNTPCFGDSGGPLTITEGDGIRSQIGVVSYVSGAGCESGWPSVFTRVSEYLDWIETNGGPAVRP